MKKWLFWMFLCFQFAAHAQDFVREKDRKTGKVLLHGLITLADLEDEATFSWLGKGMQQYQPKKDVIEGLRKCNSPYKFVVFLGTWCEDSRILIPQLFKVFQLAGIDLNAVEMYGVNRNKEALNIEHKLYNITRVPTIIVMHQFREVGRITEVVNQSIEEDLLAIMEKDYVQLEKKRLARFQ